MNLFFWFMEYLASFIEIFLGCIFCHTFLKETIAENKKIHIFFCSLTEAFIILILNKIQLFSFLTSFLFIFMLFLIQIFLYRTSVRFLLLLSSIYSILLAAADLFSAYFVSFIFHRNAEALFYTQSSFRILCIFISKTLLILIIFFIMYYVKKERSHFGKYFTAMVIYSFLTLISFFILVNLHIDMNHSSPNFFLILFFAFSIISELSLSYFTINAWKICQNIQRGKIIEMENHMLQKSLNETEKTFQLWQKSIHDYKNTIIALAQLAEDNDMNKILQYLKKEKNTLSRKLFYVRTGNSIIDAVLNTKLSFAENQGINFITDLAIKENFKMDEIDLANMLGNLLDNAIDASVKEENPYIVFSMKQKSQWTFIKIINKCTKELSDTLKTTKKQPVFHGIGLKSINDIVHRYNGTFSIRAENNEVIIQIAIPAA